MFSAPFFHCSHYTIKSNEKEAGHQYLQGIADMIQGVESSPFLLVGIESLHDHSVGLNALIVRFQARTCTSRTAARSAALLPADFWASGTCPGLPYVYTAAQIRQTPRAKL